MAEAKKSNTPVLLAALLILVGGGGGYQYIVKPLKAKTVELTNLEREVLDKEGRRDELSALMPRYFQYKKLALPADLDRSRSQYQSLLNGLFANANFAASAVQIASQAPDARSVPALANKAPAYTKLRYTASAKGSLSQIASLLEAFYKQPLLHAVRNITLKKAQSAKGGDIELSMTVETVVLNQSEARTTLFPVSPPVGILAGIAVARKVATPPETGRGSAVASKALAEPKRDYQSLVAKNVFSGPLPEPVVREKKDIVIEELPPREPPRGPDITPYVKLTGLARDDDKAVATVFDVYNKHDHQIVLDSAGDLRVDAFYYIKDAKKRIDRTRLLVVGDEDENNVEKYVVAGIGSSDVFLQKPDDAAEWRARVGAGVLGGGMLAPALPPKTYRWHPGAPLRDLEAMPPKLALAALTDPDTFVPAAVAPPKPPAEPIKAKPKTGRPPR